jgi:hypothetical protein
MSLACSAASIAGAMAAPAMVIVPAMPVAIWAFAALTMRDPCGLPLARSGAIARGGAISSAVVKATSG